MNIADQPGNRHLQDKLRIIVDLLDGKQVWHKNRLLAPVKVEATKIFCLFTVSKGILNQLENIAGLEEIGASPKSLYPWVSLSLILWVSFEAFPDILLGLLLERCPWLVPHLTLSDEIKAANLEQSSTNNKLTTLIGRQRSFIKFYGALIIARIPPPVSAGRRNTFGDSNPMGIGVAWQLLADVGNLKPKPLATAMVLTEIISVCHQASNQTYGKQYTKLLKCFYNELLPLMKADPGFKAYNSSFARLETVLEKSLNLMPKTK